MAPCVSQGQCDSAICVNWLIDHEPMLSYRILFPRMVKPLRVCCPWFATRPRFSGNLLGNGSALIHFPGLCRVHNLFSIGLAHRTPLQARLPRAQVCCRQPAVAEDEELFSYLRGRSQMSGPPGPPQQQSAGVRQRQALFGVRAGGATNPRLHVSAMQIADISKPFSSPPAPPDCPPALASPAPAAGII